MAWTKYMNAGILVNVLSHFAANFQPPFHWSPVAAGVSLAGGAPIKKYLNIYQDNNYLSFVIFKASRLRLR